MADEADRTAGRQEGRAAGRKEGAVHMAAPEGPGGHAVRMVPAVQVAPAVRMGHKGRS